MKPLAACCVWLTLLVVASAPLAYSQAKPPPAPEQAPRTKKVSLETVLSCPATSFYRNLLGLTEDDFDKLMFLSKDKKRNEHFDHEMADRLLLRVIPYAQSGEWLILPSRKAIAPEFCLDLPAARFDSEGHPFVTISAKGGCLDAASIKNLFPGSLQEGDLRGHCGPDWTLDPNEIFRHADQFTFTSGVFNNSTEVYLMAKKGQVEIQFVFEGGALKLYRVIYDDARLM